MHSDFDIECSIVLCYILYYISSKQQCVCVLQVHGYSPSTQASYEVPNRLLPDNRSLGCSHSDLDSLCLLCLWDHVPSWRHQPDHSQSLLCSDLACGPAGLLPLLLLGCFCRGVCWARDRHGDLLRPNLPWALVQECPGFPDGADQEAAALSPQDGDGPHRDLDGIHPVLGPVLRLHHPEGLPSHANLKTEELTGGLLHHRVHRHEQQHDQYLLFCKRQE